MEEPVVPPPLRVHGRGPLEQRHLYAPTLKPAEARADDAKHSGRRILNPGAASFLGQLPHTHQRGVVDLAALARSEGALD
jgi:hypothetical protein